MQLKEPKEFYKNYQADNIIDEFDLMMYQEILKNKPRSIFEFGCGSGKNLKYIKDQLKECETYGLDISIINVIQSHLNGVDSVIRGDERHLPLRKFDVIFTCSVLDHIEDIHNIIGAFEQMAEKSIILAETNSFNSDFYYQHDYESYGFSKTNIEYKSDSDGGIYHIWVKKIK
jgi:trans-aconitate methyltransferase